MKVTSTRLIYMAIATLAAATLLQGCASTPLHCDTKLEPINAAVPPAPLNHGSRR